MDYYDFNNVIDAIPTDHCKQLSFKEFLKETINFYGGGGIKNQLL